MEELQFEIDVDSSPKDDFEVAEKWETALNAYTESGAVSDIPEEVKSQLEEWEKDYMNRRREEVGASPISLKLAEVSLDVWDLDWYHRVSQTEYESYKNHFGPNSTDITRVVASSPKTAGDAISIAKSFGWEVSSLDGLMESSEMKIEFSPSTHSYEVLRRMMVAGLSRAEAMAFWTTEIIDKNIGGQPFNHYLKEDGCEYDAVARYADAVGISKEAVYQSRSQAEEKLAEIDPQLPELLRERRDGWKLPEEMWSDFELQQFRRSMRR